MLRVSVQLRQRSAARAAEDAKGGRLAVPQKALGTCSGRRVRPRGRLAAALAEEGLQQLQRSRLGGLQLLLCEREQSGAQT